MGRPEPPSFEGQRKETEEALRESEQRFRLAARAGQMFAYEWDAATDVIVRSGESAEVMGIDETPDMITGQRVLAQIHPEDREKVLAAAAALRAEEPHLQISHRMVNLDGRVICIERTGRAYFDEQGKVLRIVGITADITDRKVAEYELARSTDRLRLAMQSGKCVGWEWDLKTGQLSWFGDLQTIFGVLSETFVGRMEDFQRYVHPEDRPRVAKAVAEAMQNRSPYVAEFRVVWPDKTVRWVAANGRFYYSPDGRPERMLGMAVDITERRHAEEELRLFRRLIDESTDAIDIVDPETLRFLDVNGKACRDLGYTRDELLSRTVYDIDTALDEPLLAKRRNEVKESGFLRFDTVHQRKDGSTYPVEINLKRVKMGRTYTVQVVRDITERKQAEEAFASVSRKLAQAQEQERIRIARELHDDIGQRLALLAIGLDELHQSAPMLPEIRSRTSELQKQAAEIANDFQTLSHRLHLSKLEYLGIAAAMKNFCEEFGKLQEVEVEFKSQDLPSPLAPDISLCLFRVLQEALQNSAKHSGVRRAEARLWGTADEIHLTVRDRGTGFDAKAARQGLGLGLISMEERFRLVKGNFSIESQPKHGTTIHGRVPLGLGRDSIRALG